MKRALIIEDDSDIADLIEIHLKDMAFTVEKESHGSRGYEAAIQTAFDVIILDIMLPGMNGIAICTNLRRSGLTTPVIMLTAKSEEIDQILGLESGADVYIPKPFSILELKSKVKALFRRIEIERQGEPDRSNEVLEYGRLRINPGNRSVHVGGSRIDLTPKEFDLLVLLAAHPGRSYSREELLKMVWGYEYNAYEHTVNSHINRLRAKIEPDMTVPCYILTTWGIGYRFSDERDWR